MKLNQPPTSKSAKFADLDTQLTDAVYETPWDRPGVAVGIDAYWQGDPATAEMRRLVGADLAQHLQPGDVLEVGCGSGRMYGALRDAGLLKGRRYVGGDTSQEMLAMARSNYPGVEFVALDVLDLQASADNVVCFHVLQHLPDWRPALTQLAQAARRMLYVATWFGDGDSHYDRVLGWWNCWLDYDEFTTTCARHGRVAGNPGLSGQTGSVAVYK